MRINSIAAQLKLTDESIGPTQGEQFDDAVVRERLQDLEDRIQELLAGSLQAADVEEYERFGCWF
ncbi:MAG: hypothetical protein GY785_12335 [Gammaproteobacteria bacterium]|nr:hypothetical protein [Gammaproteobacteria bacterium]